VKVWHQCHKVNEEHVPRLIPNGYQESLDMVSKYRSIIDIKDLAHKVGITERILNLILNGEYFRGHPVNLSFRMRVRFMELVNDLDFNYIQQFDDITDI